MLKRKYYSDDYQYRYCPFGMSTLHQKGRPGRAKPAAHAPTGRNHAKKYITNEPNAYTSETYRPMITRHHLSLVIMCTLIPGIMAFPHDLLLLCILIAGSCTGVLLPDIQMKVPATRRILLPAWWVTRFSTALCVPVMTGVYRALRHGIADSGDKRLTHSVPGVLVIAGIVLAFSVILVAICRPAMNPRYIVVFPAGVMLGLVLHLAEDACTRKGISPLFPFSRIRIAGAIRPCDTADSRIGQYIIHHCSMAAVIAGLYLAGLLPESLSFLTGLFAFCSCLFMMFLFSDIGVDDESKHAGASRPAYQISS
ncbi:MAG: hypothetical protein A4E35_02347 [Methanoregula sp. PtaU1.Bin051]|nr:MAG: hypothetical protein A4E35_02347 [Methanoregula sp. PtaU1.Bin051]